MNKNIEVRALEKIKQKAMIRFKLVCEKARQLLIKFPEDHEFEDKLHLEDVCCCN